MQVYYAAVAVQGLGAFSCNSQMHRSSWMTTALTLQLPVVWVVGSDQPVDQPCRADMKVPEAVAPNILMAQDDTLRIAMWADLSSSGMTVRYIGCTVGFHKVGAPRRRRWSRFCRQKTGRLDITFVREGVPGWIDVATTSVTSSYARARAERARKDGAAARAEKHVKRSRYHNRAQPFVLEAHGRPGRSAMALVRAFAREAAVGASESAADAWAALSSVSQSGTSWMMMSAYGKDAIRKGVAEIWMP